MSYVCLRVDLFSVSVIGLENTKFCSNLSDKKLIKYTVRQKTAPFYFSNNFVKSLFQ